MQACLACRGSILFTGVGKSGFIAQKISQTLISTGTRAMYLNPMDALHGDLGMVCREDLIVLFSKSGNTEELIRLVPFAKVRPGSHPLLQISSDAGNAAKAVRNARLACNKNCMT